MAVLGWMQRLGPTFCGGILEEKLQAVNKASPVKGIPPYPDAETLSQASSSRLSHRLIGQRAGTRHDSDGALPVYVAGHDANFALARLDNPGAVGAK